MGFGDGADAVPSSQARSSPTPRTESTRRRSPRRWRKSRTRGPPDESQYAPRLRSGREIEHFAQLHDSGAMTDEEFAAAKAKVLGT